jgi:hypothetical protein
LQTRTVAPRHYVLHGLQQPLEFPQQAAFADAQPLGIVRDRLHLVQRPLPAALVDGLTQGRRAPEVPVSQQVDLADAELRSRQSLHKAFDLSGTIVRYGSSGEFTNRTSSSVNPSSVNCTFGSGGRVSRRAQD